MRVLAVAHRLPVGLNGAWITTRLFVDHLAALGHDVVTSDMAGGNIDKHRPDVVISHASGVLPRAVAVARGRSIPTVMMAHGHNVTAETVSGADLIVFNAEWMRQAVPHESPSVVCRPPVDPDVYRTSPGDMITLINLSPEKGVVTAWDAADALPDHRFLGVLGGYGAQRTPRAKNFTTIPSTNNMRDDVYSRTRILLMPSIAEAWGRTAVEAMASGIPTIAHPTPGLRESLGAAGIFVHRDDLDGWVAQIRRLDDPDEYGEASAAALRRSAELDPTVDLERFAGAIGALV